MSATLDDLKPVYLILSEQTLLVEQALAKLRRRLGEVADLDFNSEQFDAETAEPAAVIAACNTLPFASERRLVVVRNVDKLAKEGLDAFTEYVADPCPTTVLALAGAKLRKDARLYKAVSSAGGLLERVAPSARELPRAVQSMFADRGRSISLEASETLVSAVGKDLRRLSVEIDKAVAFAGERVEITNADIEAVASTTAPTSIFEFTDALADRDCRRALALAADLIGSGESVFGLQAMAVRTVRDLIAVESLIGRGASTGEMMAAAGRPEFVVRKLTRQVRNFDSGQLVDALRAAAQTDAEMKTSRDARLAFERWIVRTCTG